MTVNPLMGRLPTGAGKITADQLIDYAEALNRKDFVRAMGWEYFVAGVQDDAARLERRGG